MAIRLKHTTQKHRMQRMYFYEGFVDAHFGIIEIPSNRPHWAMRAYKLGYMLDPETDRRLPYAEFLSLLSAKSTPADTSEATPEKSVQTAESEVITYEGQSTEDTNEPVEAQPDESNDLIESSDGSNDVDNLDEPVTTGSATAILP